MVWHKTCAHSLTYPPPLLLLSDQKGRVFPTTSTVISHYFSRMQPLSYIVDFFLFFFLFCSSPPHPRFIHTSPLTLSTQRALAGAVMKIVATRIASATMLHCPASLVTVVELARITGKSPATQRTLTPHAVRIVTTGLISSPQPLECNASPTRPVPLSATVLHPAGHILQALFIHVFR